MADVLRSSLLTAHGFAHGFSLRTGGVSNPPFESLNLSRTVGDDRVAVEENIARFARAIPVEAERLYDVSQVHGSTVRAISEDDDPLNVRREEADALVTNVPSVGIGIRVADCVPILLADPESGAVGAVHAGWRGAVAGVLEAAVATMRERYGTEPSRLLAAVGPHIRVGAFEVGENVAVHIQSAVPETSVIDRSSTKPHADLTRVVVTQLRRLGVAEERIDVLGGCTAADSERFFSYRRDGQRSGRHLSVIVARDANAGRAPVR